ncbi:MAG: type II toxin-antitoxin system antitoxin SocA domain-containing protein [Chitinophagaceae bacterium]
MPYPASTIAYAIVKRAELQDQFVTQMKLQKMVYFAHGYHLAKYDEPLIQEEFEAWKFGPVVYSLYNQFASFGIDLIKVKENKKISKELERLNESAKDAIEYTWEATRHLSAYTLSNWTHEHGSPWDRVYRPGGWPLPIDNAFIKGYFTKLLLNDVSGKGIRIVG